MDPLFHGLCVLGANSERIRTMMNAHILSAFSLSFLVLLLQSVLIVSFTTSNQELRLRLNAIKMLRPLAAAKGGKSSSDTLEKFSVPSFRGSNAKLRKKLKNDNKPGIWDSVKSTIYDTVDGVVSISEKLRAGDEEPGLQEGYSIRELESSITGKKVSPGQKLMKGYRSPSVSVLQTSPQNQESAFDAFKASIYGTIDTLGSFTTDKNANEEILDSLKPLAQSSSAPSEVQEALPDLQSKNSIKRIIAEMKVKKWEEQERRRKVAIEREETIRKFKESVYKVGDSINWSAETLAAAPSKISYAAEETGKLASQVKSSVESFPGAIGKFSKTLSSIPGQIKIKSDQIQDSFKTNVEKTQKTIQDVQAFPSKVQKSISDTHKIATATKEVLDAATTNVKVFIGLEKPKPKPPKTPPPAPPTAKDIGLKVAGSLVTGTAKATLSITKGVASATWSVAKSAVETATKKTEPKVPVTKQKSTNKDISDLAPAGQSTNTSGIAKMQTQDTDTSEKPSDAKLKEDSGSLENAMDIEVEEALKQAQSAINFADAESDVLVPDSPKSDKTKDKVEDEKLKDGDEDKA